MADITEVSDALRDVIAGYLYPEGGPDPFMPIKVYQGWPDPETLDRDLGWAPGEDDQTLVRALHVSIYALPQERDTTRIGESDAWAEVQPPPNTYALAVNGQTARVTGQAPQPYRQQNAALQVDGRAVAVTIGPDATPADIATNLALELADRVPGLQVIGPDIIFPAHHRLGFARIGGVGTAVKKVSTSEKAWQVTIWADSHDNRTRLARIIHPLLADTRALDLPDGTSARMTLRSNTDTDRAQRQGAYRRDLVYSIEYATTREQPASVLIVAETDYLDPTGATIAQTTS